MQSDNLPDVSGIIGFGVILLFYIIPQQNFGTFPATLTLNIRHLK